NELPATGILQEPYPRREQVSIHLRVMDHVTKQKDPYPRVCSNCAKGDLDSIFDAIAKPKMKGQVNMQRSKIEQGRREVLFHPVGLLALLLDRGDQRAAIYNWYVKAFHAGPLLLPGLLCPENGPQVTDFNPV